MSNDQKDLATPRREPPIGVKKVSRPRMMRCEVCGQVFDARDIGDLVHHSLMGPGHKHRRH